MHKMQREVNRDLSRIAVDDCCLSLKYYMLHEKRKEDWPLVHNWTKYDSCVTLRGLFSLHCCYLSATYINRGSTGK